jgi:2-oxo-4-hydroxy-4-carboxy-5-ureidoimidazoline decarboxylase
MTLDELNALDATALRTVLHGCCGSRTWVDKMLTRFPIADKQQLLNAASGVWRECGELDGLEAFSHHPKIGGKTADATAAAEQSGVGGAGPEVLGKLAEGNRAYEEKFGYIYIVCATGRSAEEMLDLLNRRLSNDAASELVIAMGEQEKITRIRLEKLLA